MPSDIDTGSIATAAMAERPLSGLRGPILPHPRRVYTVAPAAGDRP